MPAARSILGLALGVAFASESPEVRLLLTGDVLLDRGVRLEIERTARSPWEDLRSLFRNADLVIGNLEGAIGAREDCLPDRAPCFAASPSTLRLLKQAGFKAMGLANNHAGDLGPEGFRFSQEALRQAGITPLSWEESPQFLPVGRITVALVTVAQAGDHDVVETPPALLRRKLRLARRLADLVVVYIHWGRELQDWPSDEQRQTARRLIRDGADVVVGHHPHVVQPPECVSGKPVFYSLGNHVFDQKYPATKQGLIAELRISGRLLRAGAPATRTPPHSSFPQLAGRDRRLEALLSACPVELPQPMSVAGWRLRGASSARGIAIGAENERGIAWRSPPLPLVAVDAGPLGGNDGPELLLTLERRHSSLDNEIAPRPYVYQLGPRGLVPRWRGTALAWPLLDAVLLDGTVLCALHRGDSFLVIHPNAPPTRIAAYRWNGFGFSGLPDAALEARCAALFEPVP